MNNNKNNIRDVLASHPIIPVVTLHSIAQSDQIADQLLLAGISCIEVTLRTEQAIDCIGHLINKWGNELSVGVGTLVRPEQIDEVENLGVQFLVSPGLSKELIERLQISKTPFLPGVSTPSEIISALSNGFDTLKFFPANLFGGLEALKTYAQVFPEVRFCPTGGINHSNYQEFLALPNVISVGGSWVVK
jgi:2-dehydro-3-deoxyphosphogluconate aldolase / (4S)-4-hydroxy-2-oxoglutarate aldolase